jgi:hypothetical protein
MKARLREESKAYRNHQRNGTDDKRSNHNYSSLSIAKPDHSYAKLSELRRAKEYNVKGINDIAKIKYLPPIGDILNKTNSSIQEQSFSSKAVKIED